MPDMFGIDLPCAKWDSGWIGTRIRKTNSPERPQIREQSLRNVFFEIANWGTRMQLIADLEMFSMGSCCLLVFFILKSVLDIIEEKKHA